MSSLESYTEKQGPKCQTKGVCEKEGSPAESVRHWELVFYD